ncbi:MAG: LysR family transcriptional regulator [Massilia sp.]|uniref:LysR family transcriptional regulator n=1 Tax=Massilia sp. TaxID=1882437 RepID=UPI002FC5D075
MRAFLALADTLSFSKAAQQVCLSQSALSTLISRLEEGFGSRLFSRTTRSVALSAAGEVLVLHARQLLADIERSAAAVRDVTALHRGRVALAAMPSLAARLVPRLFRVFHQRHPDIALSLADTLSEPAFELVRQGRVDFAITAANPAYQDLEYIPLTTDDFVLLAAAGHPLGRDSRPIRLPETLPYPHISMSRHTSVRQYVDAAALQAGINFYPAFEVDHLATIGAMVVEELGVAALPSLAADVIASAGLVRRELVDPVIRRSIGVVRRSEGALTPAAQAMLALLQEQIADGS